MAEPTIAALLDGHVTPTVECLDRLYPNGYAYAMLSHRLATAPDAALRPVPSRGLAAALLFPTLGPPASARGPGD